MSDPSRVALARVRLLVAVARADGHLTDAERQALTAALADHPELLAAALHEDVDVDAEIAVLDEIARREVYEAATTIAQADKHAAFDEVALLRRIWAGHGEQGLLDQVLGETRDTLLPSAILPEAEPSRRASEIEEDIVKYATLSAAAAAIPLPGLGLVGDIAVVALQVKLVRDIGQYWGHKVTPEAARSLVVATAGATGLRVAVNNLARLVPGWGAAWAAGSSFAATWAIGRAADAWFAQGMKEIDANALRAVFAASRAEALASWEDRTESPAKPRRGLPDVLAEGAISTEEWDAAAQR